MAYASASVLFFVAINNPDSGVRTRDNALR